MIKVLSLNVTMVICTFDIMCFSEMSTSNTENNTTEVCATEVSGSIQSAGFSSEQSQVSEVEETRQNDDTESTPDSSISLSDLSGSKLNDKPDTFGLLKNTATSERETAVLLGGLHSNNNTPTECQKSNSKTKCITLAKPSSGQGNSLKLVWEKNRLTARNIVHSVSRQDGCAVISNQNHSHKDKQVVQTNLMKSNLESMSTKEKLVGNVCRENVLSCNKYPTLLPKVPQPVFIVSPAFDGNVTLVTQNINILPRPREILPKVSPGMEQCSAPVLQKPASHQLYENNNSQVERTKTATKRASSGTQTVSPKKRVRRAAAETQTTGDYILKKAMRSANVPIIKQSKGSQVSPRAKVKRKASCQTNHTQTATGGSPEHKKRSVDSTGIALCTEQTSLQTSSSLESVSSQTGEPVSPTQIAAMETQTCIPCGGSILETSASNTKPVESTSTQTFQTYQYKNLPTQDSQIQTKLSMNMSLASCDSIDLQCLEELGITSGLASDVNTLPDNLFSGSQGNIGTLVQAETAIDRNLAELESSSKPMRQLPENNLELGGTVNAASVTNSVSVQTGVDPLQDCNNGLPTAEMQAQTSVENFDLPAFLSTEVQTTNFDQLYSNSIETQTAGDDVLSALLSHMETQTNEEDISWMDFGFTDIQTQTCDGLRLSPLPAVHVQTQTSVDQRHHIQIQAGYSEHSSDMANTRSADNETQTLFDMNLTDSHTQTSWNDLLKIVKELD